MCVLQLTPPYSKGFVQSLSHLSPQYKVSESPANWYLDGSDLWSAIPDADYNDYVGGLFEDGKWGYVDPDDGLPTNLSYYLYDGESATYSSPNDLYGQPLHEKERAAILSSMEAFASVTGLTFAETSDKDEANISFLMMNNDD